MGAWSHKSFDNDSALDWLDDFQQKPTAKFLRQTFETVLTQDYIEVDEGSAVIAAADLVAMMEGKRPFIEDVDFTGIDFPSIQEVLHSGFFLKALAAIDRVKNVEVSELAQLWQDSDDYARWQNDVIDIENNIKHLVS